MTASGQGASWALEDLDTTPNSRLVDTLVFLCAPTAAMASSFGSVEVLGQSIYPFKVVVPALFVVTLGPSVRLMRRRGSFAQLLLLLAGWAIIGLAWTPNRVGGMQEALILLFAALAASSLAVASCRPSGVRALLRGWVAAGYLTAMVALWEIITGQHLASDFVADRDAQVDGLILSTFGNPNNFGAFIVLTVPFIGLVVSKVGAGWGLRRGDRAAAQVVGLLLPALLVLSGSRLALIGLGLSGAVYVLLSRRWRSAWRFGTAIAALGLVLSAAAIGAGLELVTKFKAVLADDPFTIDSVQTRVNLVWNGIDFALRTHGVGLGPAGFESMMQSGAYRFAVKPTVVNAHNFWIEMLSQYGVFGLFLLITVLSAATTVLLRFRRDARTLTDERAASICIAGLAGYIVASCAASSYVNSPENWLFIASYLAMVPALANLRGRSNRTATAESSLRPETSAELELSKGTT